MDKTLYDLMDWAAIEELVYSEASNPHATLGPHVTEQGLLIQAFVPTAVSMTIKLSTGKKIPMEMADEAGFFAGLVPRKSVTEYTLLVTYDNDLTVEQHDPYAYAPQFTQSDLDKFAAGIHYDIYNKMGAHVMDIKGVKGVYFAVWAPCAMRVSVVGNFNLWDGRRNQMRKLGESGIFELFIPELEAGEIYKYEVKCQNGDPVLKADPYGNFSELRPNTASVVWDISTYQWKDKDWMEKRAVTDTKKKPMSIYELHLGSWMRKDFQVDEEGNEIIGSEFYNYREIAVELAKYVKEMGYSHVELMPVMEHPLDASWGYQVTGYYAPTSRYGTPDDFMYFMDYMHEQGIGVILDWVPAHFPRDVFGLAAFDGTCVYEHRDPRQGSHPHWGTLIYNYGRPGVTNFLIANALFWADKYHADGIRMDAVASMLYLDYGKNDGEWVANIYGGNENLEAVEFLKHLNTVFKKQAAGAVLIAEESTAWPQITGAVKEGGLGFDYKWNMGWMNDFTGYMQYDPYFRSHHYGELTFSMLYAYSEDFILVFSHDEVVHGKGSMVNKMPGETFEAKFANLRTAYGFMMAHPGKKLLFMGQDFGQMDEWDEDKSVEWGLLEYPIHSQMKNYVKDLNKLYETYPAMYEKDYHPDGFEWINCHSYEENIVIFLRKTDKPEETLMFVCNFAPVAHEEFLVGVPFHGKFKEIFNSDAVVYGGSGVGNARAKTSKKVECDERDESINIQIPPMGMIVFSCTPEEVKKVEKKTAVKKTAKTAAKPVKESVPAEKKETKPAKKAIGKAVEKKTAEKKVLVEKTVETGTEKSAATEQVKAVTEAVSAEAKETEPAKKVAEKAADYPEETATAEQKQEGKEPVTHKLEDKKPATKKIADKKPVPQKIEDKKPVAQKIADKKPVAQKIADKKPVAQKIEDKKPVAHQIEDKKPATKKIADKKPVAQKIEDKKPVTHKITDKKPATKKIADKKPAAKRLTDKKTSE